MVDVLKVLFEQAVNNKGKEDAFKDVTKGNNKELLAVLPMVMGSLLNNIPENTHKAEPSPDTHTFGNNPFEDLLGVLGNSTSKDFQQLQKGLSPLADVLGVIMDGTKPQPPQNEVDKEKVEEEEDTINIMGEFDFNNVPENIARIIRPSIEEEAVPTNENDVTDIGIHDFMPELFEDEFMEVNNDTDLDSFQDMFDFDQSDDFDEDLSIQESISEFWTVQTMSDFIEMRNEYTETEFNYLLQDFINDLDVFNDEEFNILQKLVTFNTFVNKVEADLHMADEIVASINN